MNTDSPEISSRPAHESTDTSVSSNAMASDPSTDSNLLSKLPVEMRMEIYKHTFEPILRINPEPSSSNIYRERFYRYDTGHHRDLLEVYRDMFEPSSRIEFSERIYRDDTPQPLELLGVNRQIYGEASSVAFQRIYSRVKHLRDSGFLETRLRHHVKQAFLDDFHFGFQNPEAHHVKQAFIDDFHFGFQYPEARGRNEPGGAGDPNNPTCQPLDWLEGFSKLKECVFILREDRDSWSPYGDLFHPADSALLAMAFGAVRYIFSHRTKPIPFNVTVVVPLLRGAVGDLESDLGPLRQHFYVVDYQADLKGKTREETEELIERLMKEQEGPVAYVRFLRKYPWLEEIIRLRKQSKEANRNLRAQMRAAKG